MVYGNDSIIRKSEQIIRDYKHLPVRFYNFKDFIHRIIFDRKFIDAVMIVFAFISATIALPYYPVLFVVILAGLLFAASMKHPFLGVCILAALIMPMIMYQAPGLAWIYVFAFTATLIFGFVNYRAIILAYLLISLGFSYIGKVLFIPFLILTPLLLGFKRSAVIAIIVIISIVAFSSTMNILNNSYILSNANLIHSKISTTNLNTILLYTTAIKHKLTLSTFFGGTGLAFKTMLNQHLLNNISSIFGVLIDTLFYKPLYLIQLLVIIIMFFLISNFATNIRSKYKGSKASILGVIYPFTFMALFSEFYNFTIIPMPFLSFLLAPLGIYVLELYNFNIVKALEVKKQDIRLKFGESFEDLQTEIPSETFDDIANYETVKKDIMRSIIYPIEQKGVSRAYNVQPIKGILLFGPPGNGKTMIMRALSNEIHAGFYRITAPNIISAYPGESEKRLAGIFNMAKKNSPCILFIDEMDSIAEKRDKEGDEVHKHLMSELLEELDGFQKLSRIIVVGATNRPDEIDPAILRPGRFDRSIYIPLPDSNARKLLFALYLDKIPTSKDISLDSLANNTERFSCADIKNVCESTSQMIAQKAFEAHVMLRIRQRDIIKVIKNTKPSTGLAQVEQYKKFEADFERSHNVVSVDSATKIKNGELNNIIDNDKMKSNIKIALDMLTHPELSKKYGVSGTRGILLYGPPGTGKTMIMKTVSESTPNVTMIEFNSSDILKVGAEKATSEIEKYFYRTRENKPAILFIDEIDGIVGKRGISSEFQNQIISEFLKQMDGMQNSSGIILIASTNRPFDIDPALLRPGRFDKLIYVGPPKMGTRKKMFIRFLRDAPLDVIDFDVIAGKTKGFTGADINAICNEAKKKTMGIALRDGYTPKVTQALIEEIVDETAPSAPADSLSLYLKFRRKYGRE